MNGYVLSRYCRHNAGLKLLPQLKLLQFCDAWIMSLSGKLRVDSQEFVCSVADHFQRCFFQSAHIVKNIEYAEISLLRESLLGTNTPRFCVELFDDRWIMGGFLGNCIFEIPCFSQLFKEEKSILLDEAKRYMGMISSWVAEKMMLEKIYKLDGAITRILKNNIKSFASGLSLEKETGIWIGFGEYRRFQQVIYEVRH